MEEGRKGERKGHGEEAKFLLGRRAGTETAGAGREKDRERARRGERERDSGRERA